MTKKSRSQARRARKRAEAAADAHAKDEQTNDEEQTSDRDPKPAIAVTETKIKNPNPSPTNRSTKDNQCEAKPGLGEKVIARWTRILGISTILLFLATAGSVIVLNRTDSHIADQVDTNKKELAANIAAQRAAIIFRPVGPQRVDVPGAPPGNVYWRIGLQFSNIAVTAPKQPTIKMMMTAGLGTRVGAMWNEKLLESQLAIPADMGPNGTYTLDGLPFEFSKAQVGHQIFFGFVEYHDVFGGSHKREFCAITSVVPNSDAPGVYYCEDHNCEDEQCKENQGKAPQG